MGEQYHTLSRSDFEKFIELANGIELVPDDCGDWSEITNQPCIENDPDWLFRSQDHVELERLTQFLARTAPITWQRWFQIEKGVQFRGGPAQAQSS